MYFWGFTSSILGLWSVLPKDTPTKNPEDTVQLEPGVSRSRVLHFTSMPQRNTIVWFKRLNDLTRVKKRRSKCLLEYWDLRYESFKFVGIYKRGNAIWFSVVLWDKASCFDKRIWLNEWLLTPLLSLFFPFYKTPKFPTIVQIKCISRRQCKCCSNEEKFVGKGENAGYQHFLLFPQCFQKLSCSRSLKLGKIM